MVPVAGEVEMIKPHLGSCLDTNGVAGTSKNLRHFDVTNNHVLLVKHAKPNTDQGLRHLLAYVPR